MAGYLDYFCVIEQLSKNKIIERPGFASRSQHSASLFYSTTLYSYDKIGVLVFPVIIRNNSHLIRLSTLQIHARVFKFCIDDIISKCPVYYVP